jgi:hypothetical protein
MRDSLRNTINTEITRKQFLQYIGGTLLMLFGLYRFIELLSGSHPMPHLPPQQQNGESAGFGTRRFGE